MQSEKIKNGLGESLIESVGTSRIAEITAEAADITLDLVLDDGIVKEIPVFGWFVKAYGAYCSINDYLFLKKVVHFLSGVREASADEREKFTSGLNTDPKFRRRVGENLLLLIDRHERYEKSFILGKLMARVIEGKCSHELFQRLASVIDHSTLEDLEELKRHSKNIKELPESVQQSLYKSHVLDMEIHGIALIEPSVGISISYKLNSVGEKLLEYALADDV